MKKQLLISAIALSGLVNSADGQTAKSGNKEVKNKLFYSLNNIGKSDSLSRAKISNSILSKSSTVSNFKQLGNTGYSLIELNDSTSAEKLIAQFKKQGIDLKYDEISPNLTCTTPLFAANDPWNDMGYWNSLNQNVLKEKQLMDSIFYLIKANFWNGTNDAGENVDLNMSEIRNGSHTDMLANNPTGSFDYYRNQTVNFANATLHGSQTAGVAAAKINNGFDMVGIGNIKQVKIKNIGQETFATKSAILAAMQACINEANATGNRQILSISNQITTGTDVDYDAMFNQADANGKVLFVLGAGNDGNPIGQTLSNPHSSVITVQAGDGLGNKASFSSYGAEVSFKGTGMRGLNQTGSTGTNAWQGTSASAPAVASAARLLKSIYPSLTRSEINSYFKDPKNTRTLILNPNGTLTPALNIGYLIQNLHFSIVQDYPGVTNAISTPFANLVSATHDIQTGTIANPTYRYQKNQTGAWIQVLTGSLDLNAAGNGTHNVKIEFDIAHQPGKCTEIVRQIQVSNAVTPTLPPIPTIIYVDPTECQSNPTQVGKLMNPPVAPATIAVTQDGNPITYNPVDSTFSYPVGTPGAHTIRARYTNVAGSSQKDTVYNVTAAITPAAALPTVNNANICTGQTTTFTANATNVGANPTYKWYVNNVLQAGTASTFTPPSFAIAGTYQIKYEVTPTVGGCYTSSAPVPSGNRQLNVSQSATPIGDVGPNTVAQCENTSASLTFVFGSNNGVPYTHEQYIINQSGVDNLQGTVVPGPITTPTLGPGVWKSYVKSTRQGTNTCAPATVFSDTTTITVNALPPAPTITQTGVILNVQSPIPGATYQWQKKNTTTGNWENVAGALGTSYTVTATGEYRTMVVNNGCGPVASNPINAVITSISVPNNPNGKLKIFPNPIQSGQQLIIDSLPQATTQIKVGIYDAKGTMVHLGQAQAINRRVQLQFPFLSTGMYFIRIQDKRTGKRYEGGEKIVVK